MSANTYRDTYARQRGLSLVEMLIVISAVAVLLTGAVTLGASVIRDRKLSSEARMLPTAVQSMRAIRLSLVDAAPNGRYYDWANGYSAAEMAAAFPFWRDHAVSGSAAPRSMTAVSVLGTPVSVESAWFGAQGNLVVTYSALTREQCIALTSAVSGVNAVTVTLSGATTAVTVTNGTPSPPSAATTCGAATTGLTLALYFV